MYTGTACLQLKVTKATSRDIHQFQKPTCQVSLSSYIADKRTSKTGVQDRNKYDHKMVTKTA